MSWTEDEEKRVLTFKFDSPFARRTFGCCMLDDLI